VSQLCADPAANSAALTADITVVTGPQSFKMQNKH